MPGPRSTKKRGEDSSERPPGTFYTALAAEYAQSTPDVGQLLQQQRRHRAELRKRRKDRSLTSSDSPEPPVRRPLRRLVEVDDEELSPDDSISQIIRRKPDKPVQAANAPEAIQFDEPVPDAMPNSARKAVNSQLPRVPDPFEKETLHEYVVDHGRAKRNDDLEGYFRWVHGEPYIRRRRPMHADSPSLTSTVPSSPPAGSLPAWKERQSRAMPGERGRQVATIKELRHLRSEVRLQARRIERLMEQLDQAQEELDDRDAAKEQLQVKINCIESLWDDLISLAVWLQGFICSLRPCSWQLVDIMAMVVS